MISKNSLYIVIVSLSLAPSLTLYAQEELVVEQVQVELPDDQMTLDDTMDELLDEVIDGEIQLEETPPHIVSRPELLMRYVGGFLVMRYLTLHKYTQSFKKWFIEKWQSFKIKIAPKSE